MPLSQVLVDPENGHHLALWAAKKNLLFAPKVSLKDHELLVSNTKKTFALSAVNILTADPFQRCLANFFTLLIILEEF